MNRRKTDNTMAKRNRTKRINNCLQNTTHSSCKYQTEDTLKCYDLPERKRSCFENPKIGTIIKMTVQSRNCIHNNELSMYLKHGHLNVCLPLNESPFKSLFQI